MLVYSVQADFFYFSVIAGKFGISLMRGKTITKQNPRLRTNHCSKLSNGTALSTSPMHHTSISHWSKKQQQNNYWNYSGKLLLAEKKYLAISIKVFRKLHYNYIDMKIKIFIHICVNYFFNHLNYLLVQWFKINVYVFLCKLVIKLLS